MIIYNKIQKERNNETNRFSSFDRKKTSNKETAFQFVDNRRKTIDQKKLQKMANTTSQAKQAAQLQAMMKNHSAPLQTHETPTKTLQLAKSDSRQITEGDWAHVPSGGTLTFSSLSAGCLAVVVQFNGGGGAGVHLALNMDKQNQWHPFTNAIAAKKITQVFLYGDIVGTEQGWYVQSGFDEDYMPIPNTEISPASLGDLQEQVDEAQGWAFDIGSMQEWFKAVLGADSVRHISTQTVAHSCP